jgi:hypothetical protein
MLENLYQKALQEIMEAEDEAAFPKCPKCLELIISPRPRFCNCGHEFWHIFTRFELLKRND